MPGQKCTICPHAQRGSIEGAIAAGKSIRTTARQFGVSQSSLDRHQRNCARATIEKAVQAREQAVAEVAEKHAAEFGGVIAARVEALHAQTMQLFEEARNGRYLEIQDPNDPTKKRKVFVRPDPKEARLALASGRKNLELLARLNGELDPKEAEGEQGVTFEQLEAIWKMRRVVVRA